MINLAQQTITINAPSSQVFNFVSNMENYKNWFPGVINITSANNLPHGTVGKQYKETLLMPDGESELLIKVVNITKNSKFQTQGDLAGVLPQMTIAFRELACQVCEINLQYHSRSQNLDESDDLIVTLQSDLDARSHTALITLKSMMEDTEYFSTEL